MELKGEQEVLNLLQEKSLILYGQTDYVERIRTYLKENAPQMNLLDLTFPLQENRPEKTVFDFHLHDVELSELDTHQPIFVVFSMSHHRAVRERLEKFGFKTVYYYTAVMENSLKRMYFARVFARTGGVYNNIFDLPADHEISKKSVCVYMARCIVDKLLNQSVGILPDNLIPVQAGAALTEQRIAELTDDTGENISNRNRHYSELTVAYWAWKNSTADYIGLSHYRRLFVEVEKIAEKLRTTDVEAVLPLPTLYLHSLEKEYFLRYIPDVWQTMLDVLDEMHPEYHDASRRIFAGCYFYGNNMWILKKNVLDAFLGWMFPMLFEIERRIGEVQDSYYNRYTGFCSELLTTLYFLDNRHGWRIAYAEKIFLQ